MKSGSQIHSEYYFVLTNALLCLGKELSVKLDSVWFKYVILTFLEFVILLPQALEYWDCRYAAQCWAYSLADCMFSILFWRLKMLFISANFIVHTMCFDQIYHPLSSLQLLLESLYHVSLQISSTFFFNPLCPINGINMCISVSPSSEHWQVIKGHIPEEN